MFQMVEPLLKMIPAPMAVGASAVLDPDLTDAAHELVPLLTSAITGDAGDNMVAPLTAGARAVSQVKISGSALDGLAAKAEVAVQAAIADISSIAQGVLAELGGILHPGILAGPFAPMAIAQAAAVVMTGIGKAEDRLGALGQELEQLTTEVEGVHIPDQDIPQAPGPTATRAVPMADMDDAGVGNAEDDVPGAPSAAAAEAVSHAKTALGTPYAWGGNEPGVGLDCSGLTKWAYGQAGVDLPRLADQQAVGPQIPMSEVAPGDLAVWDGHVAMVIEDGQMIEAGDPVQINPIRTDNIGMGFHGFYRPTA